jgi:hypothetical protein
LPRDEPWFLRDYDAIRARLVETLEGSGARLALDALGEEPTHMWETPNPNNRPIPGLWLQRERQSDFQRRLSGDMNAMDTLNRLAGMGVSGGRSGGPRVVERGETVWLCYQMQWRSRIAQSRVLIERALRPIANPEGKILSAMAEAHRLLLLAKEIADQTEPVFLRTDKIRPPEHLLLGLAEAPEYFARLEQERLWASVIGAPSEGTPETLGRASAFGAFAVIMHALASHAFDEQELGEMIAHLVRATLGLAVNDYRGVVHRRDVFLTLRGREVIRRQRR